MFFGLFKKKQDNSENIALSGKHAVKKFAYITYPLEVWQAENFLLRNGVTAACPFCHKVGFYYPCYANGERRYRACKFCGMWQEVGGPAYRCVAVSHKCKTARNKRVYNWFVPWSDNVKNLNKKTKAPKCQCGRTWWRIKWAIDNPHHAFWKYGSVQGTRLRK